MAATVAVVALIVLPFDFRQALTNSMIGMVIVLSYVVITGYVGQISVMQLALSGTAGFVLSHLSIGWGIPFPFSALGAMVLATLLGVAAGVSALRVRGVSLAVVTLAAALAMEQALFNNTWFGGTAGVSIPPPRLFGNDLGPKADFRGLDGNEPSPMFGFLVLAVTVALGLYVAHLRRTGLGRLDARRPLQRARRRGSRCRRAGREDRRVRDQFLHRQRHALSSTATTSARSAPPGSPRWPPSA